MRESGGGKLHSNTAGKISWCSLHNTHLHKFTECHAQEQQRGNGEAAATSVATTIVAAATDAVTGGGSNTGRANTAVTDNDTSLPTVIAPAPAAPATARVTTSVTAPPALVTALLASVTAHLLRSLPRLLLRCTTLSSHLHRTLATRSSRAPLLRAR